MTLWNCCQFKHNITGRKLDWASQHFAILNLTSFSSPKPEFLVKIFFYLFFKTFTLTWTQAKCAAALPHQYLLGSDEKKVIGNCILLCLCISPSFPISSQGCNLPNKFLRTLDWWSGALKQKEQKCPGPATSRCTAYKSYLITQKSHWNALTSTVQVWFCGCLYPLLKLSHLIKFCNVIFYLTVVPCILTQFMATRKCCVW